MAIKKIKKETPSWQDEEGIKWMELVLVANCIQFGMLGALLPFGSSEDNLIIIGFTSLLQNLYILLVFCIMLASAQNLYILLSLKVLAVN